MKRSLLFVIFVCSSWLLHACGGGGSTPPPPSPPPAATHLSVTAAVAATAGTAFNVTVSALDASNKVVSSYSGTVHFTSTDSQALFPADSPLTNGAKSFSVTFKTGGSQILTAADAAGGLSAGNSGSISVSPGAAAHFFVNAPSNSTGAAFSFTVTAQDDWNNTVTGYAGTTHFSSTDGQAVLPANSTLGNGTATLSATLKTAGSQTITATDTSMPSITGTSNGITVSGPATHFVLFAPSNGTTGKALNVNVVAVDSFNNSTANYSGTVHFASSDGQAVLPPNSMLTGGSGNFSATLNTAGNQVITVSDSVTATVAGASNLIIVSAPQPLAITSGRPPNATVGQIYGEMHPFCMGSFTAFEFEASGGSGGRSPYPWQGSSQVPGLDFTNLKLGTGPPVCPYATFPVLEGTPTTAGTFNVSVSVSDHASPPATTSATYAVTINSRGTPMIGTTPALSDGAVNLPYSFTFTATGGTPTYTWSETGALPPGISPITSEGLLSGTPTAAGSFPVTILLQDSLGDVATPLDTTIQIFPHGFASTGNMHSPRAFHTATLLSSGKVLVAGGQDASGNPLATAELYDSANKTFAPTAGNLGTARRWHTATLLNDGKVLVTGGQGAAALATAELFDPTTGRFSPTGSMETARLKHTATLLSDGTVLVTGGQDSSANPVATAELYEPMSGKFLPATGTMESPRRSHTATLLADGKNVLLTGGLDANGQTLESTELYDVSTRTFAATGSMQSPRVLHTATLLNDGRVLVAGGEASGLAISAAELYDPASGIFIPTGFMLNARLSHTSTLLNDGTVLVTGGTDRSGNILPQSELFNAAAGAGAFTATGSMQAPRQNHTATLLANGDVLVTGGDDGATALSSAELYQ
jgi:Galactose oxidase, central domain